MGTRRTGRALAAAVIIVATVVAATAAHGQSARVGTHAPELASGPWIGSEALTMAALRGRVVLLEFWTYG